LDHYVGGVGLALMKCILENTKVERIMYSVDYPFESNDKGRKWFEKLEASGMLTEEQLKKIAYQNAEQLLKVRPRQN
jgi:predicted TIM-barrel fold metal-dependent hydrolase